MTGPDRPLLEEMLAHLRATLLNICAGLTAEQLASRPIPSTNLTLLGLVRHMAKVERIWFRKRLAEQDIEHLHNFGRRRLYEVLQQAGFEPCSYGVSERYVACMEVVARLVKR